MKTHAAGCADAVSATVSLTPFGLFIRAPNILFPANKVFPCEMRAIEKMKLSATASSYTAQLQQNLVTECPTIPDQRHPPPPFT